VPDITFGDRRDSRRWCPLARWNQTSKWLSRRAAFGRQPDQELTSVDIIFAGYVLGAFALYWGLPEEVPPSWTVPGRGTFWLGAPMVAFLLPTAVAVTDLLLRRLCVGHPIDEPGAMNVLAIYDAIMLRFGIFVMGVHGAVLLAMLGLLSGREWAPKSCR